MSSTVDQHVASSDGPKAKPTAALSQGISNLTTDVGRLFDLQNELLKKELGQWSSQIAGSVSLMVGGAVLALLGLPVLLVALALWIHEATDLSAAASFGIVGGGAVVLAGLIALSGIVMLRRSSPPLPRFRAELSNNLKWLMQVALRRPPAPDHPHSRN